MLYCIIITRGKNKEVFGSWRLPSNAEKYLEDRGWKKPPKKNGVWTREENKIIILAEVAKYTETY